MLTVEVRGENETEAQAEQAPATQAGEGSDNDKEAEGTSATEIEMTDVAAGSGDDDKADDDAGDNDDDHGGSHHSHSHGHGHSHSHGGAKPADEGCEWNYINIIVAVFCTVILALLIGLLIFYLVLNTGEVQTYYIAIEEVEWSYAPDGNQCGAQTALAFDAFDSTSPSNIGSTYKKARYVQYTDETFTEKMIDPLSTDDHLGILGPVLHANVGETLRIYVRNDASFPFSINPWGLRIAKASEGAGYEDGSDFFQRYDDAIAPLALNQYTCTGFGIDQRTGCRPFLVHPGQYVMQDWPVTSEAGPQEGDGDSIMWLYTSDVDGRIEQGINAGLVGAIIVTAADADADAAPAAEFVNVFMGTDENESPYLDMNMWDKLVVANYGEVVKGWVPFGFLDQAEVLQALYSHAVAAAGGPNVKAPEQVDYDTAADLVADSAANGQPVTVVEGVHIGVQFTDPENNPLDSNSFDAASFNGRYGDGAAQQVVHGLFTQALNELKNDEAFKASNRLQNINGFAFCNQPGLEVDAGVLSSTGTVRWYTSAVGTQDSVHAPVWSGSPAAGANAQVVAGSTSVVDMMVEDMQPGSWTFGDAVVSHAAAGAQSVYTVVQEDETATSADFIAELEDPASGTVEYFLQAEEVDWDYLPGGESSCSADGSAPAPPAQFVGSKFTVGSTYRKWRFVAYEDATFTTMLTQPAHEGVVGPTLIVETGQKLSVTLSNTVTENITLAMAGLYAVDTQSELAVAPGEQDTFSWVAPAALASDDDSNGNTDDDHTQAWSYFSASMSHVHAGLVGAVVVKDASASNPTHERVLFLGAFDENLSPLASANAVAGLSQLRAALNVSGDLSEGEFATAAAQVAATNSDFYAANIMSGVNGRAFCTLGGLDNFVAGESIRVHLLALPTGSTVQSGRVGGHDITVNGHRLQTASLFPGAGAVTFTTTAREGTWEVSNAAFDASSSGVRAQLDVAAPASADPAPEGSKATRTFYIAADEIEWDYAPHGYNKCHETGFSTEEDSARLMMQGHHRIGSEYVKAQYRRYSNANFDVLASGTSSRANAASLHLGILGTIITAEVGDTVVVHFKNQLRFPANFVLPGPFMSTLLDEDGNVAGGAEALAAVAPGESKVYTWVITEEMGPGPSDGNSVVWAYGAHVFDATTYSVPITPQGLAHAGLVGAMIVVEDGELKASQTMPKDVDVEFIVLTGTFDENLSPYLHLNTQRYAADAYSVNFDDPEFQESNRMRSINGLMFCNGMGWLANMYQRVRFYILGNGDGIHSLNLHAHSIVDRTTNRNGFGASVFAGGAATGDTYLASPGDWLLESSFAEDARYGAQELFTVHPLVTQFFKQTAAGFSQRDSHERTNFGNSVRGES